MSEHLLCQTALAGGSDPPASASIFSQPDPGCGRVGRGTLHRVTAQIGADGLELFGDPRPEFLAEVARVDPEPGGEWVNLSRLGFHSTQRLRISDLAGGVVVATWPAELAPQARYLYGRRLSAPRVTAATEHGWTVEPAPHLAYHTAPPSRRLYMRPSVAPLEYATRWEDADALACIGNHTREAVEHEKEVIMTHI